MTDQTNDKPATSEQQQEQANNGQTPISSLPPDIQAMIHTLREENKDWRTKKGAADRAAQAAEEKRLADNAEWQKLAETRQKRLDELEPIAVQHGTIEAAFNALLDNQLKDIPDDVRKKLVDPVRKGMSPVDFSEWLATNKSTLAVKQPPPLDGGAGNQRTQQVASPFGTPTAEDIDLSKATGIPIATWMKRKYEKEWRKQNPDKDWEAFARTLEGNK